MGEQGVTLGELALSDARLGGTQLALHIGEDRAALMPSVCARWEMGVDYCRYEYAAERLRAALTVTVGEEEDGVLYELSLSAPSARCAAELTTVPLLTPLADALDHPAFARRSEEHTV